MKAVSTFYLSIFLLLASNFSNASTAISPNSLTITGMSTHDRVDTAYMYIKFSDGTCGYITEQKKELQSLSLAAFMAAKTVSYAYYTDTSLNLNFWLGDSSWGTGTAVCVRLHRLDVAI